MSFATISTILEPYNFQRRIVGFDTFDGFPGVSQKDTQGSSKKSVHLKKGGFNAASAYDDILKSIDVFNKNRFLNHFSKIEVVKGDFTTTSQKYLKDNPHLIVSCLYLDFDIYEPTKIVSMFFSCLKYCILLSFLLNSLQILNVKYVEALYEIINSKLSHI